MSNRVRINLANEQELLELPGLSRADAEVIVKHRAEHGPIKDASELARILSNRAINPGLTERADFAPADSTAPEAPGA